MSIKTIGLGLMSAAEAEWLVPLACDLARGFGAHLTGAHPVETITPYSALGAPYLTGTRSCVILSPNSGMMRAR
ncbi:hypothetical protein SAMN04515678_103332 [Roseivivax sediminis]|uniref:Uncharacterized protein n=1 Tax=Roseivivax sediminis TaxID=936889 RepID=A0A1I1VS75_9RHOB|nr:hypothetical protein SAMN04515678_103332 [Roseivivax sediminis]